jgi:hypothetical protein
MTAEMDARERELAECTFRPHINPPPKNVSRDFLDRPFLERVRVWQEHRNKATEQVRTEVAEKEIAECTFHPKVGKHRLSTSNMSLEEGNNETAGGGGGGGAGGAAGGDASIINNQSMASSAGGRTGLNASVRLFQSAQKKAREATVRQRRAEEEEEFKASCTFKPKVTPLGAKAKPKYLEGVDSPRRAKDVAIQIINPEYTFTPKVNDVKDFGSMQSYVASDPFERLYRRTGSSFTTDDADRRKEKEASGKEGAGGGARASSAPRSRPSSASAAVTSESFKAFLERQNGARMAFEQKVAEARRAQEEGIEHSRRVPHTNPKSKEMVKSQASFEERIGTYIERRLHSQQPPPINEVDPNCTFRPQISKVAQAMRPKTVEELSTGGYQRRQAALEAARLRVEHEKMKEATFKPDMESRIVTTEGRLRILSEPQSYVQRLQAEELFRQQRMAQAAREREEKELAECTFAPSIRDAPQYVKRIAQSMKLSRSGGTSRHIDIPERQWL